ncbi:MAG: cobaltochelatase CobT-related protein [Alphaproteobacteria bacterium]|jgi:cobaltochelatase CobT
MEKNKINKEDFKYALSKSFRAISGNAELSVNFPVINLEAINKSKFSLKDKVLNFNFPEDLSKENIILCRAEADFQALKIKFSNQATLKKFFNNNAPFNFFLQSLEDVRLQVLGKEFFEGIKNNLIYRHKKIYGEDYGDSSLSLINIVFESLMSDARFNNEKYATYIEQLRQNINSQAEFLKIATELFKQLQFKKIKQENDENLEGANTQEMEGGEKELQEAENKINNNTQENLQLKDSTEKSATPPKSTIEIDEQNDDSLEEESDASENTKPKNFTPQPNFVYKIFTKQHDEIAHAGDLADTATLKKLRTELEPTLKTIESLVQKIARSIYNKLMAKHKKTWVYNCEDGLIDSKKLSQVIIDPNYPNLYKQEVEKQFKDTVVTILLDNSGSMRGRFIKIAAVSAEILARTLESCGLKVEILGYTTKSWRGGESRKEWQDMGSPKNPGRLNDLLHIIYKDANVPWRKAKLNLALMLKEGILKENIDGEAIVWAHNRILHRLEERKIIMVISDGAPVDDSTLSANNQYFLDEHLKMVVNDIEKQQKVELIAIGIGHNVEKYYSNSITINNIDDLGKTMLFKLGELF